MRDYGSIEVVPLQRRRQRSLAAVATISCLVAVVLVAGTAYVQHKAGRTELANDVYRDKIGDVKPGGVLMGCMRCRHQAKECQPVRTEKNGRYSYGTNACPRHKGMQTVNVLRKGQVQIEWVDSSILSKANDKPAAAGEDNNEEAKTEEGKEEAKADGAKPDEKAEDAENKEEGAAEEKLMCTQPPPGMRAKWAPQQDCVPVMDWLNSLDFGKYPESTKVDKDETPEEEKVHTPFSDWYEKELVDVFNTGGAEGGDEKKEEAKPEEKKEEGKEEEEKADGEAKPKAKWVMPDPKDCYGPPTMECSLVCMTDCLSSNSRPPVLSARTQKLFDWDLASSSWDDTGYDQGFYPPLVVTGGNRDFFGINNQNDT